MHKRKINSHSINCESFLFRFSSFFTVDNYNHISYLFLFAVQENLRIVFDFQYLIYKRVSENFVSATNFSKCGLTYFLESFYFIQNTKICLNCSVNFEGMNFEDNILRKKVILIFIYMYKKNMYIVQKDFSVLKNTQTNIIYLLIFWVFSFSFRLHQ